MWSDIISTKVLGRKTYYHLYANEQVKPNPPETVFEAITWNEIISTKSIMHIDTLSWHQGIHWAYSMNAEYFLLREFITYDLGITNIEQNRKLLTSGSIPDLCDLEQSTEQKWSQKYFTTTHAHPHTNAPTETMCSMNINYFCLSEFLGFHLRKDLSAEWILNECKKHW
jgi:hypothetical protein